jgi:hypothetical protein
MRGDDKASIYRSGAGHEEREVARIRLDPKTGLRISKGPDITDNGYKRVKSELRNDVSSGYKKYSMHHQPKRKPRGKVA